MIEIVANFTRETIPVFLSGELVEIFVNFSNPDSRKTQSKLEHKTKFIDPKVC
jgi:hypothetical protein